MPDKLLLTGRDAPAQLSVSRGLAHLGGVARLLEGPANPVVEVAHASFHQVRIAPFVAFAGGTALVEAEPHVEVVRVGFGKRPVRLPWARGARGPIIEVPPLSRRDRRVDARGVLVNSIGRGWMRRFVLPRWRVVVARPGTRQLQRAIVLAKLVFQARARDGAGDAGVEHAVSTAIHEPGLAAVLRVAK